MDKTRFEDCLHDYRLFLVETVSELDQKFSQMLSTVEGQQLVEQQEELLRITTDLRDFKEKAEKELERLDKIENP